MHPPNWGLELWPSPLTGREGLATTAAAFRFPQNVTHPLSGAKTTKNWKIYLPFYPESDVFYLGKSVENLRQHLHSSFFMIYNILKIFFNLLLLQLEVMQAESGAEGQAAPFSCLIPTRRPGIFGTTGSASRCSAVG